MPIKYYLQPNPLTPDPDNQYAHVAANITLTPKDIVRKMLLRGTTLTESDLIATMHLLFTVVSDEVSDGNAVVLPLVNIRPGIAGIFNNTMDAFENGRHRKRAQISSGVMLSQKMKKAKVEKIIATQRAPGLLAFKDIHSSSTNNMLTPGGIGHIAGSDLKFNPDNATEGIFLVSETTQTAAKITVMATHTASKLMFSIPNDLPPGNYILQVRKGYGNAAKIRIGTLIHILELV